MQTKRTEVIVESAENLGSNSSSTRPKQHADIDPQVKAVVRKNRKRRFSTTDKLRLVKAFSACANVEERGAFLRKEGLYYSNVTKWKREIEEGGVKNTNSKAYKAMLERNQLQRENASLKKKLAQAEAIIDLQKKVSELLSINIQEQDVSEMKL